MVTFQELERKIDLKIATLNADIIISKSETTSRTSKSCFGFLSFFSNNSGQKNQKELKIKEVKVTALERLKARMSLHSSDAVIHLKEEISSDVKTRDAFKGVCNETEKLFDETIKFFKSSENNSYSSNVFSKIIRKFRH